MNGEKTKDSDSAGNAITNSFELLNKCGFTLVKEDTMNSSLLKIIVIHRQTELENGEIDPKH
jgi:hypothetical protein